MKRFKNKNKKMNTIKYLILIVFFSCIFITTTLYIKYTNATSDAAVTLVDNKLDKVLYQFFTDLVTDDVINIDTVGDILIINKNSKDEIISVNYDLEKTYNTLTKVSNILKQGIIDLENGTIDVNIYDKYLDNSNSGLLLNIPMFLGSKNIFVNNLGPTIPVVVNFNGSLLTNIKTEVKPYGFNNALLEIYITVEIKKLIITPIVEDEKPFRYNILIGATVVNGSVPEFYGSNYETNSRILDIPIE